MAAAYGGPGWQPRTHTLREEMGTVWTRCGVGCDWAPLRSVLLHRPGAELHGLLEPDAVQMLGKVDAAKARQQHDLIAEAYRDAGVKVHYIEPGDVPPPNLMFVADLMLVTPEGVIIGRPASSVRAGEEPYVARRLAELGVPILRTVRGAATFEGADAAWVDPHTVLLATGLRTNDAGAEQVGGLLREMGVEVIDVGLPYGAMHLMGQLRLVDRDLAIAWPGRAPFAAVRALRSRGFTVALLPDEAEAKRQAANFVVLGPREVLMPAGNPVTRSFYERLGIRSHTVQIDELIRAAGGVGCLTGVLERAAGHRI